MPSPRRPRCHCALPLFASLLVSEPAGAAEPSAPPAPAESPRPTPPNPSVLDDALQRVLAPHCANDTASLRSAALQAEPRERALLERIVRLCAEMRSKSDAAEAAAEYTPDRSGRARLVVGATGYGLWVGIATDVLIEVDDARTTVVPPLLGVGLGLSASLLATQEGEITRGQAWTVITGLDYGTYSGLLLAGTLGQTGEAKDVVGVALATGLLGGTVASIAASSAQPTAGDAEMVRSGGLWGFGSAALLAAAVQPDDEKTAFGMMLAGMDGGLLTGALLAPNSSVSRDRMLLGDAGALVGAVTGVGVGILAVGSPSENESRGVALTTLAGLHAGLWLSLYLTRNMSDEESEGRDQGHAVPHEPPPGLLVRDDSGAWRAGRLAVQPAMDSTRPGVRPVGAWLPLLGGYW